MTSRVTTDDLEFAATWLDCYEGQDDDGNNAAAVRVAAWLRAEVARRERDADVRAVVARTGATKEQARAALARATSSERKSG
jgi:hypothetical protein